MPEIHPAAFVDPSAHLAEDVVVGPNAFIDAEVTVGRGTRILHGAHIGRWTLIGENNIIHPLAVVGHEPQDLGYHGEESLDGDRRRQRDPRGMHHPPGVSPGNDHHRRQQ